MKPDHERQEDHRLASLMSRGVRARLTTRVVSHDQPHLDGGFRERADARHDGEHDSTVGGVPC